MNQNEQAQTAYQLWEKLEELSAKLWDTYADDFTRIILSEQEIQYDNPYETDDINSIF